MDEEKRKEIEKIEKEFQKQIELLEKERDAVIKEAVLSLEKRKLEEIRKNI